jgi:hypothetical protein
MHCGIKNDFDLLSIICIDIGIMHTIQSRYVGKLWRLYLSEKVSE